MAATTSPDGIQYPEQSDAVDVAAAMATMAQTIQTALGNQAAITSNANGISARWTSGLQVCWMRIAPTDATIANAYALGLYQGTRGWTFPQTFAAAPAVFCSEFKYGSTASWGTVDSVTAAAATLRGIDVSSRAAGTTTNISAVAIGLWK